MWDLSSPTRNRTHVPFIERQLLHPWITRKVPIIPILNCNSSTITFTLLSIKFSGFSIFREYSTLIIIYFKDIDPQRNFVPNSGHSPCLCFPRIWQTLIYFFSFCGFAYSKHLIEMEIYNIWSFVIDLFHLPLSFQDSSLL